jgi:hypothetical protein
MNNNDKDLRQALKVSMTSVCPCCNKPIDLKHDLWTEDEWSYYHYACYNLMKAKEQDE